MSQSETNVEISGRVTGESINIGGTQININGSDLNDIKVNTALRLARAATGIEESFWNARGLVRHWISQNPEEEFSHRSKEIRQELKKIHTIRKDVRIVLGKDISPQINVYDSQFGKLQMAIRLRTHLENRHLGPSEIEKQLADITYRIGENDEFTLAIAETTQELVEFAQTFLND